MKTTKRKAKNPGAYMDGHEAGRLADRMAKLQLLQEALVTARDAEVVRVHEAHGPEIEKVSAELECGLKTLEAFATANPDLFEGAESTGIGSGNRIGWRLGNWAAKTRKGWSWDEVREALVGLGRHWTQFLRVKTEVDKEALLKAREEWDWSEVGVGFEQKRRFFFEPAREGQEAVRISTPD